MKKEKNLPSKEKLQESLRTLQNAYQTFYRSEDLIVGNKNLSFWFKGDFQKHFNSLVTNKKEAGRIWRTHIYTWAFGNGLSIEGDLIECGVYKGFSSAVACSFLNFKTSKKKLFLIDTFGGIPENQLDMTRKEIYNKGGLKGLDEYKKPENYEICKERFSKYKNVNIIKGAIPDVFSEYQFSDKISFLHLDMNSSIPEIAALEFFYERLSKGAVCLLDDFGFLVSKEQMLAELGWLNSRGINFCELPTGQAFFIKT